MTGTRCNDIAAVLGVGGWDRWLGLRELALSDGSASVGWTYALAPWVWVLIVLAAVGVGWWSYRGLRGPVGWRVAMAGLRAGALVLLAVLLAGPVAVHVSQRVEPDVLLVMVDRSGSMGLRDMTGGSGEAVSRDAALRSALSEQAGELTGWADDQRRRVVWMGFDAGVQRIEAPGEAGSLPAADGQRTALRTSLEQALGEAGGRPVTGVVLMTEGRSPERLGGELLRRLTDQSVRVYPVPLGSASPPMDLAVEDVAVPPAAFVGDEVTVRATVRQPGAEARGVAAVDPGRVVVRLVDAEGGAVLAEQRLGAGRPLGRAVRLSAAAQQTGTARWRVEVEHESPTGEPELNLTNNASAVRVDVIDRPLRVVYLEGYPRWEYRYLVALLDREPTIDASVLLVSASEGFTQEGDSPIGRFPATAEELSPFDVVILGDVPPGELSERQMQLVREQVATRAAGLLWIGGERHTPTAWAQTPMEVMLPMRSPESTVAMGYGSGGWPWRLATTGEAQRLGVLDALGSGEEAGEMQGADAAGSLLETPAVQWRQGLGNLQPAARVLVRAASEGGGAGDGSRAGDDALVVVQPYGGGRVMYVATDETWRFRRGRGPVLFERFWLDLVRSLGRPRVQQAGDAAVSLAVLPPRLRLGQTAVVRVRVDDPLVAEQVPGLLEVRVAAGNDEAERGADASSGGGVQTLRLRRDPAMGGGVTYSTTWTPGRSGSLGLTLADPGLAGEPVQASADVLAPDDEMRQPAADHDRLSALAQATGGQVVPLDELGRVGGLLRDLSRRQDVQRREPLWHGPLPLGLLVVLLSLEWVGRRLLRWD
jgi:hypothetical protein